MFPYKFKYTESKYDIQNNYLLYEIDQKCQNAFEFLENFGKLKEDEFIVCIISVIQVLYFL